MKFFFTVTKRGLAVFLAVLIVGFLCAARVISIKYSFIDGSTHENRMRFIRQNDYSVDEGSISSKEIVIPSPFNDVYSKYNKLQKEAGFDLTDYKGKAAVVYSYNLTSDDKILHLIICDGEIIGGDVCDAAFDGEMKPLR